MQPFHLFARFVKNAIYLFTGGSSSVCCYSLIGCYSLFIERKSVLYKKIVCIFYACMCMVSHQKILEQGMNCMFDEVVWWWAAAVGGGGVEKTSEISLFLLQCPQHWAKNSSWVFSTLGEQVEDPWDVRKEWDFWGEMIMFGCGVLWSFSWSLRFFFFVFLFLIKGKQRWMLLTWQGHCGLSSPWSVGQ